jgi:4'-phosphopantetheinyl transferase
LRREALVAVTGTDEAVELWWADLDVAPQHVADDESALSASELDRAARFASSRDRDRFVTARAHLRRVLGALLGCPPEQIELTQAEGGKPRVAGSSLRFSASRSAGVALFATSWTMEVGVDLERIADGREVERVAARFFTPAENEAIAALPPAARLPAAFQCWSCKEAYVKGTGEGLSADLAELQVWSPGSPSTTIGDWRVYRLDLDPRFAAAVAGQAVGHWVPGSLKHL